jgi:hypothetical protein
MASFVTASVSHAAFTDCTNWLCVYHWCVHICYQFSRGCSCHKVILLQR